MSGPWNPAPLELVMSFVSLCYASYVTLSRSVGQRLVPIEWAGAIGPLDLPGPRMPG